MSEPHTASAEWRQHPSYEAARRLDLTNGDLDCTRLVVVAAHPDDESLGAGALIATAAAAGISVYVVLLTAGEASPFASPTKTRQALAVLRLAEMENALARLAPDNYLVFLGAPDGQVDKSEAQIATSLAHLVGDGRQTLLAAPWRHDGHDDHEAAGRAAAEAARVSGARLVEYPLLAWTTSTPDLMPWDDVCCLHLSAELQDQKEAAIRSHVSQVRAAGQHAGGDAPLPDRVLAHFTGPFEHYVETPVPPAPDEPTEVVAT